MRHPQVTRTHSLELCLALSAGLGLECVLPAARVSLCLKRGLLWLSAELRFPWAGETPGG
jgi:hypothetical protein